MLTCLYLCFVRVFTFFLMGYLASKEGWVSMPIKTKRNAITMASRYRAFARKNENEITACCLAHFQAIVQLQFCVLWVCRLVCFLFYSLRSLFNSFPRHFLLLLSSTSCLLNPTIWWACDYIPRIGNETSVATISMSISFDDIKYISKTQKYGRRQSNEMAISNILLPSNTIYRLTYHSQIKLLHFYRSLCFCSFKGAHTQTQPIDSWHKFSCNANTYMWVFGWISQIRFSLCHDFILWYDLLWLRLM